MKLDTRFLTVHPRTALWFKQREQCKTCKHVSIELIERRRDCGEQSTTMRCTASPRYVHSSQHPYCIDAREPGKSCGPDAVLFTPAP